jgi:hypothetical protein
MEPNFREEVLNVELARILQKQGLVSYPETRERTSHGRTVLPDVLVLYQGLRTIIEGKLEDQPDAQDNVHRQAYNRVTDGLAHISIAVIYPATLRIVKDKVRQALYSSKLQFEVITEFGSQGWSTAKVSDLGDILRRTFEQATKQDLVYETAKGIEETLNEFALVIYASEGTTERFREVLGIKEPPEDADGKRSEKFKAKWIDGIVKIAGLTLLNAMIFYEILRDKKSGLVGLKNILEMGDAISNLSNSWQFVYQNIDYQPIFGVATALVNGLSISPDSVTGLKHLYKRAYEVLQNRTSMKHDLMGRVYHTLLADKKYLGTYYTSVPAATMLLKVAMADKWDSIDWADTKSLGSFRAADLACGTGTLLMATYEALTDNHIHTSYQQGVVPDLAKTHPLIMESVLYGYDVLPSALHLTASTLALRSSSIQFDRMNLYSLPLGGKGARLGSIEYLQANQIWMDVDVFESALQVTGEGSASHPEAPLPQLDLCVINPPFTRSVGGNLLFGSSPDQERQIMQKKLARILSSGKYGGKIMANATAGLGSVFIAIADRYLKIGGKLALVIPKTLLSGVSWEKTRQLLASKYVVETIIASHDPEAWNFSDNTDLSEVLLIARKVGNGNSLPEKKEARVKCVNLWKNPDTVFAALMTARQINDEDAPDIEMGQAGETLEMDGKITGEMTSISWMYLKDGIWMAPWAFAQFDLTKFAFNLLFKKELHHPLTNNNLKITLTNLGNLGKLGPDARDIHDGFKRSKIRTEFPALLDHNARDTETIGRIINGYLRPLPKAKPGRNLRKAKDLWPLSGRIQISERVWMHTQKTMSIRLNERALSNVWWSFQLTTGIELQEKGLVIWLNSTVGLIMTLAVRNETRGAWIKFKKPNLESLPVLDVGALSEQQLQILSDAFDEVADQPLLPFPQMEHDPVRAKIDAAVSKALGLPDLSPYRMLLGQEPLVCLKRLG